MCRRVDRRTPEFRPYIVATHVDWSGSHKCHGTRQHTQKSQCRCQRHLLRNVVWASRPQELRNMEVSRPTWFPKDSAGGE